MACARTSVSGGEWTMNGYNFSEPVRMVLAMARENAANFQDDFVLPDHIGLALLVQQQGMCAAVLSYLGANLRVLRAQVEALGGGLVSNSPSTSS